MKPLTAFLLSAKNLNKKREDIINFGYLNILEDALDNSGSLVNYGTLFNTSVLYNSGVGYLTNFTYLDN
jgi:hypothetical protein